jgi:predicted 3-demethylubiquinone-9 3-methyltransferase (glyoxalase superfamily)
MPERRWRSCASPRSAPRTHKRIETSKRRRDQSSEEDHAIPVVRQPGGRGPNFYVSLFPSSRITSIVLNGEGWPGPAGSVLTVNFELNGQKFVALNGGPEFKFTEAVSFQIECENQEEVDRYWEKLSEGGEIQDCGWVKDRYGLSWQVTPAVLMDYLQDRDPEKSKRVMQAMLQMRKLEIKPLEEAHAQR